MPAWYQWQDRDLVLALHVQPGASHDRLDGCHDDRLKVRILAPRASSHTPDLRRGPMVDVMRMSTVIYRQVSGYNQ